MVEVFKFGSHYQTLATMDRRVSCGVHSVDSSSIDPGEGAVDAFRHLVCGGYAASLLIEPLTNEFNLIGTAGPDPGDHPLLTLWFYLPQG